MYLLFCCLLRARCVFFLARCQLSYDRRITGQRVTSVVCRCVTRHTALATLQCSMPERNLVSVGAERQRRAKVGRVLKRNNQRYASAMQILALDCEAVFLPVVELDALVDVVE